MVSFPVPTYLIPSLSIDRTAWIFPLQEVRETRCHLLIFRVDFAFTKPSLSEDDTLFAKPAIDACLDQLVRLGQVWKATASGFKVQREEGKWGAGVPWGSEVLLTPTSTSSFLYLIRSCDSRGKGRSGPSTSHVMVRKTAGPSTHKDELDILQIPDHTVFKFPIVEKPLVEPARTRRTTGVRVFVDVVHPAIPSAPFPGLSLLDDVLL